MKVILLIAILFLCSCDNSAHERDYIISEKNIEIQDVD